MSVTHAPETVDVLRRQDPELAEILLGELDRQSTTLQLIAAENFSSPAVLAALGSPLANKYAEGYPGARYHGGCEIVDVAERVAVDRAKALFGAEHANVQPHSGSSAVLAAYAALLRPGDTVLALGLPYGGHLTHGSPVNFSGRWFDFIGYGVDAETGLIDYDQVRTLARTHRPKAIVCGSIAYPRHIDYALFREVAEEVGAYLIADAAHPIGLVAGKAAPSPVPYADIVCATTHKVLRGPRGGMVLCDQEFAATVDRGCPLVLGGPLGHIMAAKAVALTEAARPSFTDYARRIVDNAATLADALQQEGATVVTGGTDNHLLLVDARPYGLTGRQAETALREAGITLNRNVIPFDPNGSWYAGGLRLGTPAVTTLGMGADEMREIAAMVHAVLDATQPVPDSKAKYGLDPSVRDQAKRRAADLLDRFPRYPGIAV